MDMKTRGSMKWLMKRMKPRGDGKGGDRVSHHERRWRHPLRREAAPWLPYSLDLVLVWRSLSPIGSFQ
jgi:hypothetical protein